MANIDELKSTGLKATLPRLKILEIFQKGGQRHMTAEDVFRVLLEDRSDIGLATVYRVLTQFEQAGILSRSHFESGKAVYELNEGQHHDHLVCLDCGRVEEFYDAEIEKRQNAVANNQRLHHCGPRLEPVRPLHPGKLHSPSEVTAQLSRPGLHRHPAQAWCGKVPFPLCYTAGIRCPTGAVQLFFSIARRCRSTNS